MKLFLKAMKRILLLPLILMLFTFTSFSQETHGEVIAWWDFDASRPLSGDAKEDEEDEEEWGRTILERISGLEYSVEGLATFVPGVQGNAIKFDGFSSYVEGSPFQDDWEDEEGEFELPEAISIEAWVSIGAYPWNWAPILTIGKYRITGFYFGVDSRGCPGFHMSDATSVWHECNAPVNPETKTGMDLGKWYHLVGTYDPEGGLAIYVNGVLEATYNDFQFDYGIVYSQLEEGFRMGMNREALPPTDPIRDWATYPSRYTLDGMVDELKIHRGALTADEVKKIY